MLTGHDIRDRIARRESTAVEAVQAALDAATAAEPTLKAYLTLTPERALARAAEIDARLARGEECGILAGVPVAVKDLFCTKDVKTTSGSKILARPGSFRSRTSRSGVTGVTTSARTSSCSNARAPRTRPGT